jgi:hypothetical protein
MAQQSERWKRLRTRPITTAVSQGPPLVDRATCRPCSCAGEGRPLSTLLCLDSLPPATGMNDLSRSRRQGLGLTTLTSPHPPGIQSTLQIPVGTVTSSSPGWLPRPGTPTHSPTPLDDGRGYRYMVASSPPGQSWQYQYQLLDFCVSRVSATGKQCLVYALNRQPTARQGLPLPVSVLGRIACLVLFSTPKSVPYRLQGDPPVAMD